MSFSIFSKAIHDKLQELATKKLFMSSVPDLSSSYLAAFPEGTNPIYLTNTEHDCSCCKNFINNLGKASFLVTSEGGKKTYTVVV